MEVGSNYEYCLYTYPLVQASICVKKEDVYVSRSIIEKGAWEEDNVVIAMKAMDFYQDAVFVGKDSMITLSCNLLGFFRCWIKYWHVHHHDGRHDTYSF